MGTTQPPASGRFQEHQLDWKYNMQGRLMKGPPPAGITEAKDAKKRRIDIHKQLRALADMHLTSDQIISARRRHQL